MACFPALLRRIRRDKRGVSTIELALATPILSIMLVGLVDMASYFSAQMSLQQAAARSLERVQVGAPSISAPLIRTEAATAAGVPESQVTVETWLECNNTKQASTVTVCAGTQDAGKYVKVTISSSYVPYFSFSPLGTRQSNGSVSLTAASSVRYS
jgi:Flp pilus assembly protein TadG